MTQLQSSEPASAWEEKAQLFRDQLGDPANCNSPMDLDTHARKSTKRTWFRNRDISMHRHEALTRL